MLYEVITYVKLNKEYKELERVAIAHDAYKKTLENIAEAKAILREEDDAEMREMAKMELDELEDKLRITSYNVCYTKLLRLT